MKRFFKYLFASCFGTLLALFAIVFIFSSMAGSIFDSASKKSAKIEANSVLDLKLEMGLPERTNNVQPEGFSFDTDDVLGLTDVIRTIEAAKEDDDIKGIYLNSESFTAGKATVSALRRALDDFKASGKFVVAYGRFYSQNGYHLASLADDVVLHPSGVVEFRGLSSVIAYYKGLIDKLDVQMRIFYAGKFKSATEPYRLDKMSDANRLQVRQYITALNNILMSDIAKSRNLTEADVRAAADTWDGFSAETAITAKLIDKIGYEDEARTIIKEKIGLDKNEKLKLVKFSNYYSSRGKNTDFDIKDKVAIMYLEGEIKDGDENKGGEIFDGPVVKDLRKILEDDKVKAVVLRVNSPGGSVMASDNILREVIRIKEAGKPVVVSMGDVAASGGYYIACEADSIFAEPNTITGSIGVFGMIPILENTLKNNLGITFDTVKTGQLSAFGSGMFDFSSQEANMIQNRIDAIYEDFLTKVSKGRGMTRDEVHEIAQGRVWPGTAALNNGLVDRLGGLDEALASAASLANLEKYRTTEYPRTKNQLEKILSDLMDKDAEVNIQEIALKKELGDYYPIFSNFRDLKEKRGVMMRLPYTFIIE